MKVRVHIREGGEWVGNIARLNYGISLEFDFVVFIHLIRFRLVLLLSDYIFVI